jgi:hypothetical protein
MRAVLSLTGVVTLGLSALVLLAPGTVEAAQAAGSIRPAAHVVHTRFGSLDTQTSSAAAEARAGLTDGMVELSWEAYEPEQGIFDRSYIVGIDSEIEALRTAGMTVTLGLGLHFTPAWVTALPDSRYVDQDGHVSSEADLVFSQTVRNAAAAYLAHVGAAVDLAHVTSIRLTSGGDEEMLYPSGNTYWAFSDGAQNGPDRPIGMRPNPEPGWRPGTRTTPAAATAWLRWYVDGLDDVTQWQTRQLRAMGFTGETQTVTPGSGVHDDAVPWLAARDLPDSVAGRGAVWDTYYQDLATHLRVEAYVSSVADGSGGDDTCASSDDRVAVTSAASDGWSATRWISRLADRYGLRKGGENPGFDASSGAAHYRDLGTSGLMQRSLAQAVSCGFSDFYWAHDEQLRNGTLPLSAYSAGSARADSLELAETPRADGRARWTRRSSR